MPHNGRILAALAGAVLSGCAAGPDFVRPEPPDVAHYTREPEAAATQAADGTAQQLEMGARLSGEWWRLFKSPAIDAVIKESLANNPGLQAAQASLRASQDNLRAGQGIFFPQIDVGGSAARQKFSAARFGQVSAGSIFNLYTLAATVGYTLDVFGGERREIEGLQAEVDVQRNTMRAAYLALLGNTTNTLIARAAYAAEIEATEQIIGLEKEQVKLAEAQAQAGTVPYSDVLALRSQLATVEASLPQLRQEQDQAEHLLATLVGRPPAAWAPPEISLLELTLPAELPVSLPSDLVRQRPDVLVSEAQLHKASADIGVATAAMFPSFTLSGSFGQESNSPQDLLTSKNSIFNVGPNLDAPLFHGGTLLYQRRAAIESYQQSLAGYRQTVLGALAQVADVLRALEHDAQILDARSNAFQTAEQALQLIQANYQAGLVNYPQVLVQDIQYRQAVIGYLEARAQRFQDTTALFVALGGGWWNAEQQSSGTQR